MKEFKGDKRTKAYKEWKASFETEQKKGLGDIVEKITTVTGIKSLVKFVAGEDCGCEERKEKLNKKFPLKRKINCLTEPQYNRLKVIIEGSPTTSEELKTRGTFIIKTYEDVFEEKIIGSCTSCSAQRLLQNLKSVYTSYEQ